MALQCGSTQSDVRSAAAESPLEPVGVFYATGEGQTQRVAEQVGATLRKLGFEAVVAEVRQAEAAHGNYCAVILAASVHRGRHERAMIDFVRRHLDRLQSVMNAFLSVSLSEAGAERADIAPEARARFLADVRKLIDQFVLDTGWRPRHLVPVAGALRYSRYGFFTRMIMKGIARHAGGSTDTSRDHEYTDWQSLDHFVVQFTNELKRAVKNCKQGAP